MRLWLGTARRTTHALPPLARLALISLATFALGALGPSAARALSYTESSTGLTPPSLEGGRTELEFADLNLDGQRDLVSIGDHGNPGIGTDQHGIIVWFGNGAGAWSSYQSGNFGYGGIAVGDVNGDALPDVGYGMHHNYSGTDFGDQLLEVALGDGTGRNWTPWDDGLATNGETWGMFGTDFADVDNDGDLDVGSISFGCCAGVHVYLNQGDGTWTQSWGFVGGNSTMEFTFGDVNGDGNADLAVGHQNGTVYLGDGLGGFTLADANLPSGGSLGRPGPDLGDVNGDGRDDLSFTNSSGGVEVWLWDPSGQWLAASTGLPASGSYDITQLADMDGDGLTDLAAMRTGAVTVWRGNGGTSWVEAASIPVGSPGSAQAFRAGGDADHNGLPDFAVVEEQGSWPSYVNRLKFFKETSVPAALTARFLEPTGGEIFVNGSVRFVEWAAAVPGGVAARARLELSTTGPAGPWVTVADSLLDTGRFQWGVTASRPSANCRLRLRVVAGADTAWAVTPSSFTVRFPAGTSVAEEEDPRARERAGEETGGPAALGSLGLEITPNPATTGARIRLRETATTPAQPHLDPEASRSSGSALLEVFDPRGRRVLSRAVRIDAAVRNGLYWDLRDEDHRPIPSGVYAIVLRVGEQQARDLLVLVR